MGVAGRAAVRPQVHTCARCGQEMAYTDKRMIYIYRCREHGRMEPIRHMDLCRKCTRQLWAWIEQKYAKGGRGENDDTDRIAEPVCKRHVFHALDCCSPDVARSEMQMPVGRRGFYAGRRGGIWRNGISGGRKYRKSRFTSMERQGLMMLDMLGRSFEAVTGALDGRLSEYRYTKRDVGAVRAAIGRLRNAAMEGAQEDTRQMINRQSRDYRLGIERIGPVSGDPAHEMVMPMEDVWQLVNLALTERCNMCVKTAQEARRCELRKLLRRYTNEPEPGYAPCGFTEVELGGEVRRLNRQEQRI